ncbi:MAG: 1-acyl-sn-glycerol-3-phosphate acyltransferase [Chitinophagaceae bacterium]
MFYPLLKAICNVLFQLLYKPIHVRGKQLSNIHGPAVLVANHPNSLLDALLIGTYCNQPVHFIVRSDMFNKPIIRTLLKWLNGIPVYRTSEEKHRLRENLKSFQYCKEVLQKNGVILFFGEGMTVHDWNLKPMRSGLTRLLDIAMEDAALRENLQIVPVAVNYSKYQCLLKAIHIDAGKPLTAWQPGVTENYIAWKKRFQQQMFEALAAVKYQMRSNDAGARLCWQTIFNESEMLFSSHEARVKFLHKAGSVIENFSLQAVPNTLQFSYSYLPLSDAAKKKYTWQAVLLFIPTILSLCLNGIPNFSIRWFCRRYMQKNIFYDSVLTVGIMIIMPLWWIAMGLVTSAIEIPILYWMAPAAIISGYLSLHGWIACFALWNHFKSNTVLRAELQRILELSNTKR